MNWGIIRIEIPRFAFFVATYPVFFHSDTIYFIYRSTINQGSYECGYQYLDGRDHRGIDVSKHIVPWDFIIILDLACSVDHIYYCRRRACIKWFYQW